MAHSAHTERRWRALEPHREKAIAVVRRLVGGYLDPEDCVHDAMVRVVQWGDPDPERGRGLLLRAVRQVAIDRFRTMNRAERAFMRLGGLERNGRVVSPEEVVIDRDEVRQALAMLANLTTREREVMELRLRGLSPAETAERLGLTLKSVEAAYSRARARFRAGP